ncbi:hypothetical protein DFH06DRAFT_1139750 [Mycena polygramma]|nr:hypothetical protein DFH06DRAFT_1139750 [Mycena polygramma]
MVIFVHKFLAHLFLKGSRGIVCGHSIPLKWCKIEAIVRKTTAKRIPPNFVHAPAYCANDVEYVDSTRPRERSNSRFKPFVRPAWLELAKGFKLNAVTRELKDAESGSTIQMMKSGPVLIHGPTLPPYDEAHSPLSASPIPSFGCNLPQLTRTGELGALLSLLHGIDEQFNLHTNGHARLRAKSPYLNYSIHKPRIPFHRRLPKTVVVAKRSITKDAVEWLKFNEVMQHLRILDRTGCVIIFSRRSNRDASHQLALQVYFDVP